MPYIIQTRRGELSKWLQITCDRRAHNPGPRDAGELNFCLTCLILKGTTRAEEFESVMKAYLTAGVPLRYQRINDVIGAAESAILEADRRAPYRYRYQKLILNQVARRVYFQIAGPYEDMKREENGDIEYDFDGSKRT